MNKKRVLILMAFTLILSACFSPWKGDEGTLTVSIGGGTGQSRQTWNGYQTDTFLHIITITGAGQEQETRFIGEQAVSFTVTPGCWDVEVKAYSFPNGGFPEFTNIDDIVISDTFPDLVAEGSTVVDVKPGSNAVVILMHRPSQEVEDSRFNVNDENGWYNVRARIAEGGNDKKYIINIVENFDVSDSNETTETTFGDVTGISVTITGSYTLSLNTTGSLLIIGAAQTVILENITLNGSANNTASLVQVIGGNLTMRGNAKVSGNTNNSGSGGGVYVKSGTFTMYGGEISGNSANDKGGGVYVENGTFRMAGGTVYGNNADEKSNTAPASPTAGENGAALYVVPGSTAEYGTFDTIGAFTLKGDLETTDDTINVVAGERVFP